MRLEGQQESENVEDRRGGGRMPGGMALGGGIGGLLLVVIVMFLGGDPKQVMNMLQQGNPPAGAQGQPQAPAEESAEEKERRKFVSIILKDTEEVWGKVLPEQVGVRYAEPKLVLFSGQTDSGCGGAESAMGPFYCPADTRVYIDLSFFDEMQRKLHAPGEFARAYVIAHEVGHHVQRLLGTSDKVHEMERRAGNKAEANQWSVRLELQADYYAGVWAHHAQKRYNFLETGDLESAIGAAKAVGDDTLQKSARGYAVPDSFTHGKSEQRMKWFRRGFETGDMRGGQALFELPYDSL